MSHTPPGLRVPAIFRPAVLLFDGISGRDRRRARQLKEHVEALRQESQQLSQERESLQQEIGQLRLQLQGSSLELQQELNQRLTEAEQLQQSLRTVHGQCDRLNQQVKELETEREQLQNDLAAMEEWVQQADLGNTELERENLALGQENQELRQIHGDRTAYFESVVAQLEAFEQRLRGSNLEAWQAFQEVWKGFNLEEMLFAVTGLENAAVDQEPFDLSDFSLALVGGHDATRRGVVDLLAPYGLKQVVEIPPSSQSKISQSRVKAKIQRCDLIVIIAGYLSHKLTDIIDNLSQQNALSGERLYLNCRGSSGVVREILLHLHNKQAHNKPAHNKPAHNKQPQNKASLRSPHGQ